MVFTRRQLVRSVTGLQLAAAVANVSHALPRPQLQAVAALPDKANFPFSGIHFNAAYTHPIGKSAQEATHGFIQSRMLEAGRNWPRQNSRGEAVSLFAKPVNAQQTEIAVVPSTLEGENLVAAALGLGPGAGVVTDPFHYDASLVMYGELHKHGMPLALVAPRGNFIDLADLEAAITDEIRLVAVSLVSSDTGHLHDLNAICEIAHRKGALVYADIIQAAGAITIDVKASGVDFCCAGTYKWMMGEFGMAFLYVRSDRLQRLKRVQVGWRGIKQHHRHYLPFDSPGPLIGDWDLGSDTASVFEVSTPNWSALATIVGSLNYIDGIGVAAIRGHCDPMLLRLQEELPRYGFDPLTPFKSQGPYVVFSQAGVEERFRKRLEDARIYVTLAKNRIRISTSVYNSMDDIERLIKILRA